MHKTLDDQALQSIEVLRCAGDLRRAQNVAEESLARTPYDADLHDAYARVLVDRGQFDAACDAWETVRMLAPGHLGALKGLGFLAFRRGDLLAAERLLADALSRAPHDAGVRGAFDRVRAARGVPASAAMPMRAPTSRSASSKPTEPPMAANAEEALCDQLLLANVDGLVLAGNLGGHEGADRRASTACEMSALARALEQATSHLEIGPWVGCLVETDGHALAVSRPMFGKLLLTAATGEGAAGRALALGQSNAVRTTLQLEEAL